MKRLEVKWAGCPGRQDTPRGSGLLLQKRSCITSIEEYFGEYHSYFYIVVACKRLVENFRIAYKDLSNFRIRYILLQGNS